MASAVNPKTPKAVTAATKPPAQQTLNVYGAPKAAAPSNFTYGSGNPQYVAPKPVVTPKPGGSKILAPKTNAQMAADSQKILDQLGAIGKRLDTVKIPTVITGDDDGKDDGAKDNSLTDPNAYAKMQDEKAQKDAFAILRDTFASYGLSELSDLISGYMKEGIGTGEANLRLKQSQPYKDRFYGNELRLSAGRNVITEAQYLDLEDSYSETLKAYGLQNYFGTGVTPNERKNRQKSIASVIGADISAVEFKERVVVAVDRVKMADPATKNAFQQFYGIGESDLAQYFLDPTKNLVNLKEKATAAEIGGAAIGQGLSATMTSAEDLAKFGINREQAQLGYGKIAEELPTTSKLSGIYTEAGISYNQADAEAGTFKDLASAKRKKERLKQLEESSFKGSAGVGDAGLSTTYLRRGSSAGQF